MNSIMKDYRLLFVFYLLTLLGFSGAAQTTIIDGNSESSFSGPLRTYYNYGLHQNIYLQSEVGSAATITGLEWEWDDSHATTRTIKIWLGHTAQADFSSTSNYVPTGSMTLVYEGTLSLSSTVAWTPVTFDQDFSYDGTNNLVIAVEDNTGSYSGSSNNRFKHLTMGSTSDDRAIYQYSDVSNYTMESPTFDGISHRQPSLKLYFSTCPGPSSPTSSSVTSATATISWTAASSDPGVGYDYYLSTSSTDPTGGTTPTGSVGLSTSEALAGLSQSTTYYYWVRSDCGGADYSDWTSVSSFTTPCPAQSVPFSETFDNTSLPSCWSQSATTGGPWVFNTANVGFTWNNSGCGADPTDNTGNSGYFAKVDLSNTTGDDIGVILEMPDVDVTSLGTPLLQFSHWMCGTGYSPLNSTYIEYYNGTAWSQVAQIQSGSAAWVTYDYELTTCTYGANLVRIRFRVEDEGSSSQFYGDIAIDDISIIEKPCSAPTSLVSSAIGSTTATISWDAASPVPATGYDYYLSTSATDPTGGTTPTGSVAFGTLSVDLTGLTVAETYYFWVRSDCDGSESDWSSSSTFTTVSCTGPTSASGYNKLSITQTTAEFSWVDGSGASTIVVASTSPLSGNPAENATYTANINYGSGDALAGGYVVYSGTGNSITVQNLTANTTYYLGIYEMTTDPAGCYNTTELALKATVHTSPSDLIGLGTGTTTSDGAYLGVFNNYWESNRCQMLYKASELGGTADNITDISFDISQVAPVGYRSLVDFTVNLMHTSTTSFSTAFENTASATEVFSSASYSMPTSTGYFEIDIADFAYNGTDNLIVEIIWGENAGYASTGTQYFHNHTDYSSGVDYLVTYGYADNTSSPTYDGRSDIRPNIQFGLACGVTVGTVSASSSVVSSCEEASTVSLSGQDVGATLQWQYSTDNTTYYDIDGATTDSEIAPYISRATVYIRAAVTTTCTDYTAGEAITSTAASGCNYWEGTVSADASDASNWSQGVVPASASTDALVLKTLSNSPTYSSENSGISVGNFWIQDGATFNAGIISHYVAGNFTNNGTFNSSTGTINMKGFGAQAINGTAASFYNLTINNSSTGVTLGAATTVSNALTLTSGIVDASGSNLILTSGATVSGGSDASHVNGTMVKTTASTSEFIFPLGDGTQYKAISITPENGTSTEWTSKYFNTVYSSTTLSGGNSADIDHVSTYEYWDLARSGSDKAKVNIPWVPLNDVQSYTELRLAHWDGSGWENIPASTAGGSNASGNLISTGYQDSFSPFTLASSTTTNVLPIELVSFTGEKKDNRNILNWTTASEINNAYFTVEKSYNGFDFEWVGTQEGSSPSTQIINYSLSDYDVLETLNYYRLKQTDFDGKFEYSKTISIDNRVDNSFKEIIGRTNLLGQEVDEFYNGIVIVLYKDGTSQKFYQFK